ncbi:MAG: TonB family protein [Steroidobacteraceae bacterium]
MQLPEYYRNYELAWESDQETRGRLQRLLAWGLAIFLLFGIGLPFIHLPKVAETPEEAVPPRLAQLMVQEKPKPPAPKPVEQPKEEPKPEAKPKPTEQPKPEDVRKKVQNSAAMRTIRDQFADLRDTVDTQTLSKTRDVVATPGQDSRSDRSMIASKAGDGSAGITTANASRGFGSGAGALGNNQTGSVTSNVAAVAKDGGARTGANGKGGRSDEEVELVFDKGKGALYALYSRALREQPDLQGKLVLELTISPGGDVTVCRVVSSELKNPELEAKIVARVKQFKFEAKDVNTITVTKPIEFFPA